MSVRNCREIGENLQKIMNRLLANDNLVKLLYYNDTDPLSHNALTTQEKSNLIFNKLIKILPKITTHDTTQSCIAIRVQKATQLGANREFKDVQIVLDVFVPWDQWMFNNTNLRPFAILGEIQESLDGKSINGLGKMTGGDFVLSDVTNEVAYYEQYFNITSYD